ncbi:hypothetical protein M8J77_014152 [Diaphorina citri]|nr:hypothetical protein M8J77_014152 [Diaphorina citri]
MRSLAEIQKILTGSKENIPEVLDQIKAAYLKNNQTAKYISCDILEHIQYIVLYVYMFTLIAISIDRYRYIKYENVNIQARYSSLFINLYIWLACTILVCIQKGIFKYKNIIEINPSMCKYEIKFNRDINYGLITITDILPFAVVLSILLYTYTVFGILLYYLNIYSKIRWKKLTKKLKEIDNIVEMSFNLIERKGEPACEDSGETKKVLAKDNGKKWKELKKQARSFSKARDDNKSKEETKIEEIDNQVAEGNEQTCVKETDNENAAGNRASGNQNKHNDTFDDKTSRSGNNLSTNTVTHADNNEIKKFTPRDDSFDISTDNINMDHTQEFTKSTDSIDFLKTSSSFCEPLNLYKDEHAQTIKMHLKQHKILVNVSEINDRIVIQTISQNVDNNSNYNLETGGVSMIEMNSVNANNDGVGNNERINMEKVRTKNSEELNEEIHLIRERAEELNFRFILMLFCVAAIFLLLWLPMEIYTYNELLTEKNFTKVRTYTVEEVYDLNAMNLFNLFKSLNVIVLFVFFYTMYNNFHVHFHASLSRLCSFKKRNKVV